MPGAAGGGTVRHLAQAQSRLSTLREEKKNMNPETTNTSDRETSGGKRKIIMKAQVPDAHHRPTAPVDETWEKRTRNKEWRLSHTTRHCNNDSGRKQPIPMDLTYISQTSDATMQSNSMIFFFDL